MSPSLTIHVDNGEVRIWISDETGCIRVINNVSALQVHVGDQDAPPELKVLLKAEDASATRALKKFDCVRSCV